MASPQKENGYTSIANEIRDEMFLRDFKPTHRDMLELIWRTSYGCLGRKFVYFDNYKYFEIIGIKKSHVKERLNYLIDNNVLTHIKEFNVLVFNKDFDKWKIPKVEDYDKRKKLLNDLIKMNLSYQFGNEVTEIVTMLHTNTEQRSQLSNDVTDKRERFKTDSSTGTTDTGTPKESIKYTTTSTIADVKKFYEDNGFGLFTRTILEDVNGFIDDGFQCELIIQSMKESIDYGAHTWAYAKSILVGCYQDNVTTIEQFKARKLERERKKVQKNSKANVEQATRPKIEVFNPEDDPNYELFKKNGYAGVQNGKNVAK